MFALSKSEIVQINSVSKSFEPNSKMDKLGAWGILHLVCGAIYGQSPTGASSLVLGLPNPNELIKCQIDGSMRDELIALIFSNYIKEWSNDRITETMAKNRLNSISKNFTDEMYDCQIRYIMFAILLNSLDELDGIDDFNQVKKWTEDNENGWEKAFFGAGLILSEDKDFHWKKYRTVIRAISGYRKEQVDNLFSLFNNNR